MSKDETPIVSIFTGKKHQTSEDIIRQALEEGKFKDCDFCMAVWKDEDPHPNKGDRTREYYTSGISYGALLWELEMFKATILFN